MTSKIEIKNFIDTLDKSLETMLNAYMLYKDDNETFYSFPEMVLTDFQFYDEFLPKVKVSIEELDSPSLMEYFEHCCEKLKQFKFIREYFEHLKSV